ncbi:MAG: DNA methyltransferase [Accumulibacter sp.]|uniref:DNA methyltransferase n=1 Tax=Accumulibacter sp. TaxID=2053492 RepID=UPI0033162FC5
MSAWKEVQIGDCRLILGDCREVLPTLPMVDAVIVDPPYSKRCHERHDSAGAQDGPRSDLGYSHLTHQDITILAAEYALRCKGWVVWMTDSDLALFVRQSLESVGRYAFAPLPFYQPGRSVRLSGDGPCSWTDYIIVARTTAQSKWGTLPGGYVAGPGWNDKARMGGKPTHLMRALVSDYSRPVDMVLDSHMGAGTTGVACAIEGRRFIGIEIDRAAFDIACERIDNAYRQAPLLPILPVKQIQEALI